MSRCLFSYVPSVWCAITENLVCSWFEKDVVLLCDNLKKTFISTGVCAFASFCEKEKEVPAIVDFTTFSEKCRRKKQIVAISVTFANSLSKEEKRFLQKLIPFIDICFFDPQKQPVECWTKGVRQLRSIFLRTGVIVSAISFEEEERLMFYGAKAAFDVGKKGIVCIRDSLSCAQKVLNLLEHHPYSSMVGRVLLSLSSFSKKEFNDCLIEIFRPGCLGVCYPVQTEFCGRSVEKILEEMISNHKNLPSALQALDVPYPLIQGLL